MKLLHILPFIIILLLSVSCGLTESEARKKCFNAQLGTFALDTQKTFLDSARLKSLSGFQITFKDDWSFFTNMSVPYLDDTIGTWDPGTCGFENHGKLSFNNTRHVVTFAPYRGGNSWLTIRTPDNSDVKGENLWL